MTILTRREFAAGGAAIAAAGFSATATAAAAAAMPAGPKVDPLSLVDPELRPVLQEMSKLFPDVPWSDRSLKAQREGSAAWEKPPLAAPAFTERQIPGAPGAPDVRIYVIGANPQGPPRPAVLHMHGGGYIAGSAKASVMPMQELALKHDGVVVTVDYRLAPETKFPGALEDNYAALRWLYAHAAELGVDPTRIALMGESAGGGHAAQLAIHARDRGEVPVAFQLLIYPMLDDRTGSTREPPAHLGAFTWKRDANRYGWTSLLGVPAGAAKVPAGAVPARVANLAGLPPTFIGVGAIDLFVQEDIAYAQRLVEAGVPTELVVAPGGFHGFDVIVPQAAISRQFTAAWHDALSRALNTRSP